VRRKLLVAALAVVVLAAGAGVAAFVYRPTPGDNVQVAIPSGASTKQVASILADADVIGSTLFFRAMSKARGMDGKLQAGRYDLKVGMGVQAALDELSHAPIEKGVSVPIPEGFSVKQIGERFAARTQIKDFKAVAESGSVRGPGQPQGVNTLEGFLWPETYFVGERENAAQIAQRMVDTFDAATKQLDYSVPESRGVSRYQALIIASLIEREARVDEDRAKVAAVIYNRLKIGMRLQIDITALYGLDEHKVPTRADLRRESPYNTYLIDGLPPTPIANPGLDSIEAALHPANINAIYYVVIDPSGRHGFTDDPAEFERLKQQRPPEVH
jgi:UPF0755 protein